jgi:hypothetical protein
VENSCNVYCFVNVMSRVFKFCIFVNVISAGI